MALINTTTTGVLGSTFFGDGTGPLTVQQNGVTLGIFGNQPTFSYYQGTQQTGISAFTTTKVTFTTLDFDTTGGMYSTANSRFTPTVAGYYHITANMQIPYGNTNAGITISIEKNGSTYKTGSASQGGNSLFPDSNVSALVFFNGTTDYVHITVYGSQAGTTYNVQTGIERTYFQGILVKAV